VKLAVPINERDHAIGPPDALVTVVNYGDYECPDCRQRHRAVEKMFDQLVDSVRFVYRHFPLVNVHTRALRVAEAAEAAAAQGKFWEMHRRLYTHPDKLDDRHLRHHANQIGLDLNRFDREMAGGAYSAQILDDYYNSLFNGITGVPTTFINGELYSMSGVELLSVVKTILEENQPSRTALP
jgi:formate-nitrite transporter family protein